MLKTSMFIEFTPDFLAKYAKTKRNQNLFFLITFVLTFLLIGRVFFGDFFSSSINSATRWIVGVDYLVYVFLFILWIVTLVYKFYSPQKNLIRNTLSQNFNKKISFKTLYCRKEAGFSDQEAKLFQQSKLEQVASFIKKFGTINPFYVCEVEKGMVGVYYYVMSNGKSSTTHYLSVFQTKPVKLEADFEISKEGFLDKFKHDLEIGDEAFDQYLKIVSNSSDVFKIKTEIDKIGREKILNFMRNKGVKIVADQGKLLWIKEINYNKIPRLHFSKKDYTVMPHGIELKDDVILRNVREFEDFVKEQMI